MRPSSRKTKKWRKKSPANHRSFGEKRERFLKHVKEEMNVRSVNINESK